MKPARLIQQNASVVGNGRSTFEQILQGRQTRFAGVHTLNWLWQLHLIADQHDIGGSTGHGDEVAK